MEFTRVLFQIKVSPDGTTAAEARSVAIAFPKNKAKISQLVTVQLSSDNSSSSSSSTSIASVQF